MTNAINAIDHPMIPVVLPLTMIGNITPTTTSAMQSPLTIRNEFLVMIGL